MHATKWEADAWNQSFAAAVSAFAMRHPDARRQAQELLVRASAEAARQEKADSQWSGVAAEFARSVAALIEIHANTNLLPDERGATARAAVKPGRFSPVERLHQQGVLDADQLRAARQLAGLVERMTKNTGAKAAQLEAGRSPSPNAVPLQIAEEWSLRYVPWSHEQIELQRGGLRHLGLTLDVVVWGCGFREACARVPMGRHRGYQIIGDALNDWRVWSARDSREIGVIRAHAMARGLAFYEATVRRGA